MMVGSVVTDDDGFASPWLDDADVSCACASGAESSAAAIAAERSENPLRLVCMDHPPEHGD
jgi:hypothetical protein